MKLRTYLSCFSGTLYICMVFLSPLLVTGIWKRFDTSLKFSTTCNLQTDGNAKVTNRILRNMITCLSSSRPKQWDQSLPQTEFSFNGRVNRFTGKTPFDMVYTKVPSFRTDLTTLIMFKSRSTTKLVEDIQKM